MDNFVAHILVVDDDEGIRTLVKKYLNENNYLVTTAISAEDAFEKIQIIKFDLIILDIMMPGKSGLEFIKENQKKLDTPVILLTAKGEADERVEGLEVGADDYLPKPFEPKELLLRIQNIIRKTKKSDQKRVIQFENIKIDLNKQLIIKKNTEYKINNTEKKILEKMINNPGKTFSREDIGILTELDKERSIDVIITRLRKKIEIDPIADKIIVAAALILLVMDGTIKNYEVIAAIIILTREILISGLREFLAKGKIKLPVSNLAKLKTVLQMVSIGLLLSGDTGNKIINFQDYNAQTIGIILLWLSAALTLFTGYEYIRKGIDHAISEDNKD